MARGMEWFGAEVTAEMEREIRRRLDAVGLTLTGYAVEKSSEAHIVEWTNRKTGEKVKEVSRSAGDQFPKRTGDFRNSIAYFLYAHKLGGRWGTNIKYGKWLELGTRNMAPRPWMTLTNKAMRGKVKKLLTGRLPWKYLREAIYNGLVKALGTSRVYHRLVPRGTALPYYTYKVDASFRDASTVTRGNTRWDCSIRVECFGIDPDVLETAQRTIETFFLDWEPGGGTASGYVAKIDPVDEDLDVEPDRDDEGNEIWHGTQIFEALYIKGTDVSSSSSSSSSTSESSSSTASSASSSSDSTSSSSSGSSSSESSSSESPSSSSTSSTSSYSSASESSSSDSGP